MFLVGDDGCFVVSDGLCSPWSSLQRGCRGQKPDLMKKGQGFGCVCVYVSVKCTGTCM